MTPLAIFWNLFLYIVWKFRIMPLKWVFLNSNLTVLRYPEIIDISEKIDEKLEDYLPEKIHLKNFIDEKVTKNIYLEIYLEIDDPLLVGLANRDNVIPKYHYSSSSLLSSILELLTYIDNPKTAPFNFKSLLLILLDTYLIMLMMEIPYPDVKNFLTTFALVSAGWLGIYRLIGELLISDFLVRKVEEWFISRDFKKIKILAIVLLPVFTLHSLLLLSILRFVKGEGWGLEAELDGVLFGKNVTFMDFFLSKLLKDFNLKDRINSEFIPEKCAELKEAVVMFLKDGNDKKLKRFFKKLPEEIEEFVEDHVDFLDIALVYVTSGLENLASKILP